MILASWKFSLKKSCIQIIRILINGDDFIKVFFDLPYDDNKEKLIRESGYAICSKDEFHYADVAVCNGGFINNNLFKFKKLKLIQILSSGYDKMPLEEIKSLGIRLCNAKGVYSIPISEWIILKILEIYKKTRFFEENQKNSNWVKSRDILELYGKTAGIIGTGSIGSETAKRLKAFDCIVYGLSRTLNHIEHFDSIFTYDNINSFLKECDILVIAVPLTHKTTDIINNNAFMNLKDGCVIVNISRGPVINEEDLIRYLDTDRIRGVALDVFNIEPLPQDSLLWRHEKVIITPHNSFISDNISERLFNLVLKNLDHYINNQPLENEIIL